MMKHNSVAPLRSIPPIRRTLSAIAVILSFVFALAAFGVQQGTPTPTPTPIQCSDAWTATATAARRGIHTAVWTGSEMIVWGGFGDVKSGPTEQAPKNSPRDAISAPVAIARIA